MLENIKLDIKQLLIRGSTLENTEWIFGIVVYPGAESKLMLN
jgi:hypothetical protein